MLNKEVTYKSATQRMLNSSTVVGNTIITLIIKELVNLTLKTPI